MRVFVSGATGYVGNRLMKELLFNGFQVHTLLREPSKKGMLNYPGVRIFEGDLNDVKALDEALDGCKQIYHVAGFTRLWAANENEFYETNVKGTFHLLEQAVYHNVDKLVYTSNAAVFGHSIKEPLSEEDPRTTGLSHDLDLSKFLAEKIVLDFAEAGLETVVVNPTRIYGPGLLTHSNIITRLLNDLLKNKLQGVPNCDEIVGNYTFIDDVINGHLLAMQKGVSGQRYILGGENISYGKLYQLIQELTGRTIEKKRPLWAMKMTGYVNLGKYYIFGEEPLFTPKDIDRFYHNSAMSSQKAIRELGYSITPLKIGLERTLAEIQKNSYV